MDAAQYLRKSRMEEGMDTSEVLAAHRTALSKYAAANNIHIVESYCEVVSGESLYARPEMLRLLEDVEERKYDAVLVMDLDRLSRGRMKDQGIILDAFRDSGTLIVTPEKTYDLSDEIDDELAEFKTFMSRREYKIINKRLRRGLNQSIQDGCYHANAPYGYRRVTIDRKPTLEINEDEAKYVRLIYEMYTQGYGCTAIARHITALGAKPHRSAEFNRTSIAHILRNPTFTGKIVWNQKKHIRKGAKGNAKHITIYQPKELWTVVEGRHPAIIGKELYDKVQSIMEGRYVPGKNDGTVKSPLVGLVRCGKCGQNMQRMLMKGTAYLLCTRTDCCAAAKVEYVEEAILQHLRDLLMGVSVIPKEANSKNKEVLEASLVALHREQAAAGGQKEKLYELLELGEYDLTTFRDRMEKVKSKIAALDAKERDTRQALQSLSTVDAAALRRKIHGVLDAYDAADAAHRNAMLKSVIDTIVYTKEKKTSPRDFQLAYTMKPF